MLGELHFGATVNLHSHPAIVDADVAAVQRMSSPRGRRPKSERLLARLGVLRCGTCGARMVVGTTDSGKTYGSTAARRSATARAASRSAPTSPRRRRRCRQSSSTAARYGRDRRRARRRGARARRPSRNSTPPSALHRPDDVDAARERLPTCATSATEHATGSTSYYGRAHPGDDRHARGDWDLLTLDEQRASIVAVIDRAVVAPGRGSDRIRVEPRL